MEEHWAMIWHQAITGSLFEGKAFGWDKTCVFQVKSPVSGNAIRLKFSNRNGKAAYEFGAVRVYVNGQSASVCLNGKDSFSIPVGGIIVSDPCGLSVSEGAEIQLRMYYTNAVLDSNMIEEDANLLPGNRTMTRGNEKIRRLVLAKLLGAYNAIPSLEAIEICTQEPAKAIVAFGDSITAMSRWTKPLARRLAGAYGGEFVLLNSGISGNCLLYEPKGMFGPVFGDMGTKRFQRDVLDIPNLNTVIIGLGVNDVSYLSDKTSEQLSVERFRKAVTEIVNELHAKGVRVVMQTISPRLGVARTLGKYTKDMEKLRLQYNAWIRSAEIFDYVFDAEAVVREERPDGLYYAEGLHQGDHLHPNTKGGQKLAEAYNLQELTGK